MAVEDAVELLAIYLDDEGETLRNQYGPEALAAASDMAALIADRLESASAHVSLWNDFQAAPRDHIEELAGVLESQIEGDPSLARLLSAFLRELRSEMTASESTEPEAERDIGGTDGDALDDAVSIETDQVERDRLAYHPEAIDSSVDYNDSVDRGTYIYGEVAAGKDNVGQEAGVEPVDVADPETRPIEVAALNGVSGLFEQLRLAVEDHPVLDHPERQEILAEFTALQEAVQEPEAGEADHLAIHLRRLETLAPDIAEIVIEALTAIELPIATEQALTRLRLQSYEEGHTE